MRRVTARQDGRPFSPDDEDITRKKHAAAGRGAATTAQAGWDCAGYPQHLSLPRFIPTSTQGRVSAVFLALGGGTTQDPDIFDYAFHSASFPPKRANRRYYSNPRSGRLIDAGRTPWTRKSENKFTRRSRRYWRMILPTSISGTSTMLMVHIRAACRGFAMTKSSVRKLRFSCHPASGSSGAISESFR